MVLRFLVRPAVSAAHLYGSRLVNAEAFTSLGPHWEEDPFQLKPVADRAFCEGIDQQDAPPVAVAHMAENRLAPRLGMEVAGRLVIDIHVDALHFRAFADALQHMGEGGHLDMPLGHADEDADRQGAAAPRAAGGVSRRLAVAQLLGHALHPGAG